MSHLNTLSTGAARSFQGLSYSESIFSAAWSTLRRKFGPPDLIISAQLSRIQSYQTMKSQDSKSLVRFTGIFLYFVGVLQHFSYSNDQFSSRNSEMAAGKLPLDMRRKWFAIVEKPQNCSKPLSFMDLNTWLQEQSIVPERFLSSMKTSEYDPGEPTGDSKKRNPKDRSSSFEAVVSDKKL